MKNNMGKIDGFIRSIGNIMIGIGMISMSIMILINVICRYFFGFTLIWVEELARYIMVWVTFIGVGACAAYNEHVKIEILLQKLSHTSKKAIYYITHILMLLTSLFIMYLGWMITYTLYLSGNKSATIGLSIWWLYLSIPIGFTILSFHLLKNLKKFEGRERE